MVCKTCQQRRDALSRLAKQPDLKTARKELSFVAKSLAEDAGRKLIRPRQPSK